MDSLFNQTRNRIHPSKCICHSGGAIGADTIWEEQTIQHGGQVRAYSYKTTYHNSPNKVEISNDDYNEGILEIQKANRYMNRPNISKYMNLLARNWTQVKYSSQIFAIGTLVKVGEINKDGYINKGKYTVVDGGTGYAVMMGILNNRLIYLFDQIRDQWFTWSYKVDEFIKIDNLDVYISSTDFTGIGTRDINEKGIDAIKYVFENTII